MGVGTRWTPNFPPAWLGRVSSSSPPQKMLLLLPTAPHRCSHRPWSWTLRCRPAAKTLPSGTLCKSVAGGGHPALPPLPLVPGHAHGGWGGPVLTSAPSALPNWCCPRGDALQPPNQALLSCVLGLPSTPGEGGAPSIGPLSPFCPPQELYDQPVHARGGLPAAARRPLARAAG